MTAVTWSGYKGGQEIVSKTGFFIAMCRSPSFPEMILIMSVTPAIRSNRNIIGWDCSVWDNGFLGGTIAYDGNGGIL